MKRLVMVTNGWLELDIQTYRGMPTQATLPALEPQGS